VKRLSPGILVGALMLGVTAADAHHSFAAIYDPQKPVEVTGKVTSIEWLNPHARFYVDVKNDSGGVDNWECELASPNGLMRIGWTRKSLGQGDEVTVDGLAARDGAHRLSTRSVTRADGTKLFSGDRVQGGLE
jgi:Family of unknown function (DUF6152)